MSDPRKSAPFSVAKLRGPLGSRVLYTRGPFNPSGCRSMSGLFPELDESQSPGEPPADAPLAARMRPRTLDEFIGQEALIGPGTPLRRAIEDDRMTSAIFWGPPGCGKSTLAGIIARMTSSAFEDFSAVTSGVAEMRAVMARARERRKRGARTLLFVDERSEE